MAQAFGELTFTPTVDEIIRYSARSGFSVLTGSNNSGKSAYLKKTISDTSRLYIGVNRFYSFHHLPFYTKNDSEVENLFQNLYNTTYNQLYQNYEGSFFNAASAITRLNNKQRSVLFGVFREMFGSTIEVLPEDPDNDFSNRYVAVDGDSLSVTSSGTRLFLGILAALMDDRFRAVTIDEPELGLSPTLQRRLADILIRGNLKRELFTHDPIVILSTHSHLFLDKQVPNNNWIVSRERNIISARQCQDISEVHEIQFRLLGNDLSELLLPDAIIFVEGETDKAYLDRVVSLAIPSHRFVVQQCNGDISRRLSDWSQSLGDMQTSPYRNRTLVIMDSVKQDGLLRVCDRIGLPAQSRIEWSGNGIEYVYPIEILSEIFRDGSMTTSKMIFDRDRVSHNSLTYTKADLNRLVCNKIDKNTDINAEVDTKLISVLRNIISR